MKRMLMPAIVFPDDLDPKTAKVARLIYETAAKAYQDLQEELDRDPRLTNDRIATGVRGMGNVIAYVDNPAARTGAIATLIDNYNWTFALPGTPGPGGVVPDLSIAGGWSDLGTDVVLTTNTDQVGIGTQAPAASLDIVNVNNTSDVIVQVKVKSGQTGLTFSILSTNGRNLARFNHLGQLFLGNFTDATTDTIIGMGGDANTAGSFGVNHAMMTWGDNIAALSGAGTTADMIGVQGARLYMYKDSGGQFDSAYGQGLSDGWVIPGDISITYSIWTGNHPSSPYLRGQWDGNGDYTNYGKIRARKSLGAGGASGTPGIELEETGTGTQVTKIRAAASLTADRTVIVPNCTGQLPIVGDDPPAVAAGAMGKVDSTGLAAAVGATNLTNGALAGLYEVSYHLVVTTLDATAGTIQFQVNYTDVFGATNQVGAAVVLTATGGRDYGVKVIQLTSGELSYQTNLVTVGGGAERYALYVRVKYLG